MNEQHIESLRRERALYVADDLPHRVEQVDIELARYGVDPHVEPEPPKRKKITRKDAV